MKKLMIVAIICALPCVGQAGTFSFDKVHRVKVDYPSERESRGDRYQAGRDQERHTHSYMYVNPFFQDYYSNYYDNDGTQFYFFYQKDDPTFDSNDTPSNYNNDTDFSVTPANNQTN